MKNCHKKLKELIEEVVLNDIEDHMDEIFEKIAKDKKSSEILDSELKDLHEMRDEFHAILQEIEDRELSKEECIEIYEDIMEMIQDDNGEQ